MSLYQIYDEKEKKTLAGAWSEKDAQKALEVMRKNNPSKRLKLKVRR